MISAILLEVHRTLDHLGFPVFPRDDDYFSTTVDSILVLLDQMIAIFGVCPELLSPRSRVLRLQYALHLTPGASVAAWGFGDSSIQMGLTRGPKININLDQVELLLV